MTATVAAATAAAIVRRARRDDAHRRAVLERLGAVDDDLVADREARGDLDQAVGRAQPELDDLLMRDVAVDDVGEEALLARAHRRLGDDRRVLVAARRDRDLREPAGP